MYVQALRGDGVGTCRARRDENNRVEKISSRPPPRLSVHGVSLAARESSRLGRPLLMEFFSPHYSPLPRQRYDA